MINKMRVLHWLPRVLCIVAILFISMFATDAFEEGRTIGENLTALFMHLIPTFALTAFLVLAWKKEMLGGIAFLLLGLIFSPFIYTHNYNMNHSVWMSLSVVLMINMPFVVVGLLFLADHHAKKKYRLTM